MSRKYSKDKPEMTVPVDKSVYDVSIDYPLIDYIATKCSLSRFDEANDGLKKAHAISLLADGWTNAEIVHGLGLSRATMEIWAETDELYRKCLEFIHNMEIKDTEQMAWRIALTNPNATNERAMVIKAEIAKYRENALPPSSNVTMLRISLNGNDMDFSANFKPIQAAISDGDDD